MWKSARTDLTAPKLYLFQRVPGKNTDSIAGSTQMFIKVSEHKTRPVKRAGGHNSRQRKETGDQSNQAPSHSTRQRG